MSKKGLVIMIVVVWLANLSACMTINDEQISKIDNRRSAFCSPLESYFHEYPSGPSEKITVMKSLIQNGYFLLADYLIETKLLYYDNELGLIDTGIAGYSQEFSIREVTLTQGHFIEVYSAGSMGTGYLYLYQNTPEFNLAYKIDDIFVIDINMDWRPIDEVRNWLTPEVLSKIESGTHISWILANGRLEAEYGDFNSDGFTDIRLYGIRETFITPDGEEIGISDKLIAEDVCTYTYMFNPDTNSFICTQASPMPPYSNGL